MNRDDLKVLMNIRLISLCYFIIKSCFIVLRRAKTATKAFVYYLVWTIKNKDSLYIMLHEKGCSSLKPINILHWKNQVKYFSGLMESEKVFIKTSGKFNITLRETTVLKYIQNDCEELRKYVPILLYTDFEKILIEKWIDGITLDKYDSKNDNDLKEIVLQIFCIYQLLKKYKIKHMDIKPTNFMVTHRNNKLKVILIDFGYGMINSNDPYCNLEKSSESVKVLKDLGSDYAIGKGVWDDAYSTLMTIKNIYPSFMQQCYKEWESLNEDIGVFRVKINGERQ